VGLVPTAPIQNPFPLPRPDLVVVAESMVGPSWRLPKWRYLIPISTSFIYTRTNSTPFTQGYGQTKSLVLPRSDLLISESRNAYLLLVAVFDVNLNLSLPPYQNNFNASQTNNKRRERRKKKGLAGIDRLPPY